MRFPMPEKAERMVRVNGFVNSLKATGDFPNVNSMSDGDVESVVDATAGLTRTQMNNVLCMALVHNKGLDVDYILNEKRKLVEQAGFQMTRPLSGFEKIGGLNPLKKWAKRLRKRFTKAARDYGFPRFPRGLLMAGVPGCGKSAISKALANEWNMNLLTVQATDLKGSLVGESEAKVHRLLETAKAASPDYRLRRRSGEAYLVSQKVSMMAGRTTLCWDNSCLLCRKMTLVYFSSLRRITWRSLPQN